MSWMEKNKELQTYPELFAVEALIAFGIFAGCFYWLWGGVEYGLHCVIFTLALIVSGFFLLSSLRHLGFDRPLNETKSFLKGLVAICLFLGFFLVIPGIILLGFLGAAGGGRGGDEFFIFNLILRGGR